jgi:hypothetical protein
MNVCHCLIICFDQPEADENPKGDGDGEDVDITGDGTRVEPSARGESAAGMTGNDTEAEVNVSVELPSTATTIDSVDAGITHQPEVWVLESKFIFE